MTSTTSWQQGQGQGWSAAAGAGEAGTELQQAHVLQCID
jgi:hypothetical protein